MEEIRKEERNINRKEGCGKKRAGGDVPEVFQKAQLAELLKELQEKWSKVLLSDRGRISSLRRKVLYELEKNSSSSSLEKYRMLLEKFSGRFLGDKAASLRILFPENLPIYPKVNEIKKALTEHQTVIVCGSTGSGKTTQLPKIALQAGFGKLGRIGCTQPRRLAATALAGRLAEETGCVMGEEVGCKIRFDDRTNDSTVIKFMTDGILLAETRSDPLLLQYDCIILDEVHERSLNIDFLLGYLKLLLEKRRDLRLIISSATLESGRISEFFSNAPVIEVEGGLYPIEDCYLPAEEEEELADHVSRAVDFLRELDDSGDILVFLPGEREIRETLDKLEGRKYPSMEILPLFGRLSASDQNRIFSRSRFRRVILSTNVAETSLTIPGIRFVIDSGLVRLSRYNPKSRIQELLVEGISQASARQRRGRCGRLRDGVCVRLYSEETLLEAPPYTAPEIQRTSLAGVILQMASLKLPPVEEFPFVDPPSVSLVREGRRTLEDLHALEKDFSLTRTGRRLAELPLDPHLGKMLMDGEKMRNLPQMLVISAFLSIADPRERPFEHAKEADEAQKAFSSELSDFMGILKLWIAAMDSMGENRSKSALKRFCAKNYLSSRRMTEWRNLVEDLGELFPVPEGKKPVLPEELQWDECEKDYNSIHKCILGGLPRNLAMYDPENKNYMDMGNKRFILFPGSGLAKRKNPPKWLLSFALMETSRVFGRINAEMKPEWLEEVAPHLCRASYDNIFWDEKSGFVYAREQLRAGSLLIHPGRRRHYGKIDPAAARNVFIREGLAQGKVHLHNCAWLEKYNKLYKKLRSFEIKMRHPDSLVDEEAIYRYFNEKLPEDIVSTESIKHHKEDFAPSEEEITWEHDKLDEKDFPDFIFCDRMRFPLRYLFDCESKYDGITVSIPENCLNLFDPHRTDYLVPGYLFWKVEFLLKGLPKSVRRELNPMRECVKDFVSLCKSGEIFIERPLTHTLAEYLKEYYDQEVSCSLLEEPEMPPYLVMKIALTGENGRVMKVLDSFPGRNLISSRLSNELPAAKKYTVSGHTSWPFLTDLPYEVEASPKSGKKAYPALVDEKKSVGSSLFLDEHDAAFHHREGLLRLVKLRFPQLEKALRQGARLAHNIELSFFLNYPDWKEDLADISMLQSLDHVPEDVRTLKDFEEACEKVSSCSAEISMAFLDELEEIHLYYTKAEDALKKIRSDSETADDVNTQLDFLFRPGFLRCPEAVGRYTRYLKALTVRLERAKSSSLQKDLAKGESIAPFIRKFHIAAESLEVPLERKKALYEFFLLLEEARIGAYTPEISTLVKAPPSRLAKAWDELSL
ncbi:MAG: ATP-dependent RNA helicase HrpA [Lentisphaeria bacterium]|nr:ATP-dependent RNA helicase HrpA [Lentisphaeria bacterium]